MELSSSGVPVGVGSPLIAPNSESKGGAVTLISYAKNGKAGRAARYNPNTQTTTYSTPPVVAKKSAEKFFKTFRKRSKSASRLGRSQESLDRVGTDDFRGSDCSLNNYSLRDADCEPSIRPSPVREKLKEKVTLVGFSSNSELNAFNLSSFDADDAP